MDATYWVMAAWLFGMFQSHLFGLMKPAPRKPQSKSLLEQYIDARQALFDLEKEIEKGGNKIVETGETFELVSKLDSVKIPANLRKKQSKQGNRKSETENV